MNVWDGRLSSLAGGAKKARSFVEGVILGVETHVVKKDDGSEMITKNSQAAVELVKTSLDQDDQDMSDDEDGWLKSLLPSNGKATAQRSRKWNSAVVDLESSQEKERSRSRSQRRARAGKKPSAGDGSAELPRPTPKTGKGKKDEAPNRTRNKSPGSVSGVPMRETKVYPSQQTREIGKNAGARRRGEATSRHVW